MEEHKKLILSKINNAGALSSFLQNSENIGLLNYLNNNIPNFTLKFNITEKLWYFIYNISEQQLCKCGEKLKFNSMNKGYKTSCGKKECFVINRKETCLNKYGEDNPRKVKEFIDKAQNTILEKYNGKHYMYDEDVRNKFNNTMLENHGVEWAQQNIEIKEKSVESFQNNPKHNEIVENRIQTLINKSEVEKLIINNKKIQTKINNFGSLEKYNEHIKEKSTETSIEKYGVPNPFMNEEVQNKRIESYKKQAGIKIINKLPENYEYIQHGYNMNKTGILITIKHTTCGRNFIIYTGLFNTRLKQDDELCLCCNPRLAGISRMENNIVKFIKENYDGKIIQNSKSIISNELDIYLPELDITFEFNGLYWHCEIYKDENYHLNKNLECLNKEINLTHIWEDEWVDRKDIIKSMILNKLGKSIIIDDNLCEIRENIEVENFLNKNHIKGYIKCDINIGLYYNDELISVVLFNKLKNNSYDLIGFCEILNHRVNNGYCKIFKYFIKRYKPSNVISHSENNNILNNYGTP